MTHLKSSPNLQLHKQEGHTEMSTTQEQAVQAKVDRTIGTSTEVQPADHVASVSLPARIAALEIGQTCSESQFLDFDTTSRASFEQSVKALRSTMSKAVARATSRTGNTYITVTGDHRTRDGDMIVVATAVRTT